MYGPAKKLSRVNANLQQTIAASERIFEMLDTHTEVHDAAGRDGRSRRSRAAIEFRDVGFGYEDDRERTDPARRVVDGARPGRWWRSSGAAAPARRRWST